MASLLFNRQHGEHGHNIANAQAAGSVDRGVEPAAGVVEFLHCKRGVHGAAVNLGDDPFAELDRNEIALIFDYRHRHLF